MWLLVGVHVHNEVDAHQFHREAFPQGVRELLQKRPVWSEVRQGIALSLVSLEENERSLLIVRFTALVSRVTKFTNLISVSI